MIPYNKKFVPISRVLRKNMTAEEKHLWYDFLKKLPMNVNRQKIIENYIVDFFIAGKRVAIELDGSQHRKPENEAADEKRDSDLRKLGITVLRYTNLQVNQNFNAVCEDILKNIGLQASDLRW